MTGCFPWRWMTLVAILLTPCCSSAVFAITGGLSVEEVLSSRGNYGDDQVKVATQISGFIVPLFVLDASGRKLGMCTSTVVHPRVVLTAAHCVLINRNASGRMVVEFERGATQRKAKDAVMHPDFDNAVTPRFGRAESNKHRKANRPIEMSALSADLALVLLHGSVPETYSSVALVQPGYRDNRAARKLIAGYGRISVRDAKQMTALNFAELQGNTRLDEGELGGNREIILLTRYRNGARANVCSGDSGGPLLVLERGASRWLQVAVTSAADDRCNEGAIFANIDSQRAMLREMFDTLMEGEQGANGNPF